MKDLTDLTTQCIRCGFCLESCPTFVVTGKETESPRGRIYLSRSAEEGKIAWEEARPHLNACLGCRACETACPSGVHYGEILELARDRLEKRHGSFAKKALLAGMTKPGRLRMQLGLAKLLPGKRIPGVLSRLLSGQAPEADRPVAPSAYSFPPLDEAPLPPIKGEVYVLEGCVMRVLYGRVNEITKRLLRQVGFAVRVVDQGCCGALHAHNGYLDAARSMGQGLSAQFSDDLPIVVNSAGCGSTMKEYENLGVALRGRVFDAAEFLAANGLGEVLSTRGKLEATVTYHDACHLSHGQGIRREPRELLAAIPGVTMVELNEAEMCCGSAGIYNLTQPKMARTLLERKWGNVEQTGASIVATRNPGCHAWISQAAREHGQTVEVLHTLEVLERALSGSS